MAVASEIISFFSNDFSLKCLLCGMYSIGLIFISQIIVDQSVWKGVQMCL